MKKTMILGGYFDPKPIRDITIDLMKGMGIILMVIRHTEAPYSEIISLFHMAIFFIASGYLFKNEKIKDIKCLCKYALKKMRTLWMPYVVFSIFFVLLNNAFIRLNIYTDNPLFLEEYSGRYPTLATCMTFTDMFHKTLNILTFQGSPQLGGALWFFQCLFYLSVGYAAIDFVLGKIKNKNRRFIIQCIISICFLMIGWFCNFNDISARGMNRFFSYYCLYFFGNLMKEYSLMEYISKKKSDMIKFTALSFLALSIMELMGITIEIVDNNYINPIILLISSIAGWIMLFSFATFLKELDFSGNHIIEYISIHSVAIIVLHFLAFKIVNWIAVMVYGMNYYMIAAFPVLMHGFWWIAYTIVGIALPLLLNKVYMKIKYQILSLKRS